MSKVPTCQPGFIQGSSIEEWGVFRSVGVEKFRGFLKEGDKRHVIKGIG